MVEPPSPDLQPYTVVLTSCGRFDLLHETLSSFYRHVDFAPHELIVVEDSADDRVRRVVDSFGVAARTLVNAVQLGQMRSIDRAYAQVTTPLIFHCEDDWLFTRGGFIRESATVLQTYGDVSMVGLRPRQELNPLVRDSPVEHLHATAYFRMDPKLHPEYFSYSFNPGLRRLADYTRLGPFEPIGGEGDVSYAFKTAGFRIANLEIPAVRHIGSGRHVHDPAQTARPQNTIQRLQRSMRKRLKRLRRAADNKR